MKTNEVFLVVVFDPSAWSHGEDTRWNDSAWATKTAADNWARMLREQYDEEREDEDEKVTVEVHTFKVHKKGEL
jgi:hypothetical protein